MKNLLITVATFLFLNSNIFGQSGIWVVSNSCKYFWAGANTEEGLSFSWNGNCKDGLVHGKGALQFYDQGKLFCTYKGQVASGMRSGDGEEVYYLGNTVRRYKGRWKEGKLNGEAEIDFEDGRKYKGNVINYTLEGKGEILDVEGGKYVGDFKQNAPHGKGINYFADGSRYEGDFANGNLYGKGIYYFADGNKYEGEFANGQPDGFGTYYYTSKNYFIGQFKNNSKHGKGVYYLKSGEKLEGNYINGSAEGDFTHWDKNGVSSHCKYKNNELVDDNFDTEKLALFVAAGILLYSGGKYLIQEAGSGSGSGIGYSSNESSDDSATKSNQEKNQTSSCFGNAQDTKLTHPYCNSHFSIYKVKCSNGNEKRYFHLQKEVSCGALGLGGSKGYYIPGTITDTYLGSDFERAMKKLCDCQ